MDEKLYIRAVVRGSDFGTMTLYTAENIEYTLPATSRFLIDHIQVCLPETALDTWRVLIYACLEADVADTALIAGFSGVVTTTQQAIFNDRPVYMPLGIVPFVVGTGDTDDMIVIATGRTWRG